MPATGSALEQLMLWRNEELTEFELAVDRGRQVAEELAHQRGAKRGL
jgi:hypothetical protein